MPHIDENFVRRSLESSIETLKMTRPDKDTSYMQWDNAKINLENGKVIQDIMLHYRIKNDIPKCPRCGASYDHLFFDLSRMDNFTHICPGVENWYEEITAIWYFLRGIKDLHGIHQCPFANASDTNVRSYS